MTSYFQKWTHPKNDNVTPIYRLWMEVYLLAKIFEYIHCLSLNKIQPWILGSHDNWVHIDGKPNDGVLPCIMGADTLAFKLKAIWINLSLKALKSNDAIYMLQEK